MLNENELSECNEYLEYYEKLRQTFNFLAEERQLSDDINHYIIALKEAGNFDHAPYIEHLVVNGFELVSGAISGSLLNDLGILHSSIDYYHHYENHQLNHKIMDENKRVSENLLATIKLLNRPQSYQQALGHQKLLNQINIHFCDEFHKQDFENIRNNINSDVDRYSNQQNVNSLKKIEQQNKQTQQNQLQMLGQLQDFRVVKNDISKVKAEIINKSDLQTLLKKLSEHEVVIGESFQELLAVSQPTYNSVCRLVEYMEIEKSEKMAKNNAKVLEESYSGLISSCQLVGQLANLSGSKDLYRIANLAQASIQVHQGVSQILSMGSFSLAMLNPVSAIGMAALSVFSLFKKSPNQTAILMKQIAQISKQINNLRQELLQSNKITNEKINYVLKTIQDGFDNLERNQTVPTKRMLSEIQGQLLMLSSLVKKGFQDVQLKDLNAISSFVFDINNGISPKNQVDERIYSDKLRLLRDYILQTASTDLFTGFDYRGLLEPKSNPRHFVEIMNADRPNGYINLLGLLAFYAEDRFKVIFNDKSMFHPEIWRIAIDLYIDFKSIYRSKYQYDPDGMNLRLFQVQGQKFLSFFDTLRKSDFYKKISQMRSSLNVLLHQNILTLLNNIPKLNVDSEIADLLNSKDEHFVNLRCEFTVPSVAQGYDDYVKQTNQYFGEQFQNKLSKLKITCPKEFLVAQSLGICGFYCRFVAPDDLKKRHHKHYNKFVLKSGVVAGLEIDALINGERIPLFRPVATTKKITATFLSEIYNFVLKHQTRAVYHDQVITNIMRVIHEFIFRRNKELARDIGAKLTDSWEYTELLKLDLTTLGYLHLAGFPRSDIDKFQSSVLTGDITTVLASYISNGRPADLFPSLLKLDLPKIDPLEGIVKSTNNASGSFFQISDAVAHVNTGLLRLQELIIAENCYGSNANVKLDNSPKHISQSRYSLTTNFAQSSGHSSSSENVSLNNSNRY